MMCPKCDQPVPDNARFCGKCGQQVDGGAASANPGGASTGGGASSGGASDRGGLGGAASMGASAGGGVGDFGSAATAGVGEIPLGAAQRPTPGVTPQPYAGLIERVKNILVTPKTEWLVIEPEPTTIGQLYSGYVVFLAAFASIMSFIRMSVIGVNLPFGGTFRTPFVNGLTSAVITFVMGLIGLFLVGWIINVLAPTFAGERNQRQALKTAAYAFTPAWLGTVLTFLPMGTLLQFLAGIYGIYVLYLGLPILMRSKPDKAGGYTATVVICTILVGILFGVLSAALGGAGRLGGFGGSSAALYNQSPEGRAAAAEQGGAVLGNVIGSVLGTDEKGKQGLATAMANLAKAGQQIEQQQANGGNGSGGFASGSAGQSSGAGGAGSAAGGNGSGGFAGGSAGQSSGAGSAAGGNGVGATAQSLGSAGAGGAASGGAAVAANSDASATSGASGAASGDNTQNAMAAAGGMLAALGGALGGSHRVEPVDFKILKGMLPASLPDMQRTGAEGSSQQAIGVKSTSATANYQGTAGARVEIKIADMSGVSGLMDAASGLVATGESESDNGFEKDAVLNGRPVHEKYDNRNHQGEISAIVAKRFEVDVNGSGMDMAQLEKTLGSVDLAQLEAMKNVGAVKN